MKLSKSAKNLIASDLIYTITLLFAETFLVAYLFEVTNENITQISIYYIIMQIIMGVGQALLGGIIKNKPKLRTKLLSLGIIFRAIFILFIVLLGEEIRSKFVIVAILCGISETLYWATHEMIFIDVTKKENRKEYMAIKKSLGTILNIIAPIILGTSIQLYSFTKIAIYIFILSFIQIFISLKININDFYINNTKYSITKYLKELKRIKNPKLKNYYYSNMVYGIIEDPMSTLVTVITVMTFKTSLNLGIITTIISIFPVIVLYIYKKYYNENNAKYILTICSTLILVGAIGLAINIGKTTLIIYNFAVTIGLCLFDAIFNTQKGDLIEVCNIQKWNVEHVMINELLVSFSRVVGYILLLIVGIINNIIVFKMLLIFIALIVPIYSNMVIKVERNSFK